MTQRTRPAVLKVLYLLAVTAAVFAVPAVAETRPARWWVVGGLLVLQAMILVWCGVERREVIRPLGRLKWLFAILLAVYALLPGEDERTVADWHAIPVFGRVLWVNLGGLALAALMCLQILTVLLASGPTPQADVAGHSFPDVVPAHRCPGGGRCRYHQPSGREEVGAAAAGDGRPGAEAVPELPAED